MIQPAMSGGQRVGIDPTTGQIYSATLIGAIAPGKGNPADGMVTASNPGSLPNSLVQDRGIQFIPAGEQVYEGQVVGEHCRDNDLPVNVCREKKLTNMRASGTDKAVILKPPRQLSLETALEYIEDDEYVEITPKAIRLRKTFLKENDRKRYARKQAAAEV